MLEIHKERLLKLADHLSTLQEDQLNMEKWHCGTQSCALGHACTIFPELTLHEYYPGDFEVLCGGVRGFAAAKKFFGDYEGGGRNMAIAIFAPQAYHEGVRIGDVVRRIRSFAC